ncbi:MAG: hypothetical protein AB7S41_13080 [Parvibaculaceae bacterium]
MDKRKSEARERKLAEALRANLARRKAEARAQGSGRLDDRPLETAEDREEGSD